MRPRAHQLEHVGRPPLSQFRVFQSVILTCPAHRRIPRTRHTRAIFSGTTMVLDLCSIDDAMSFRLRYSMRCCLMLGGTIVFKFLDFVFEMHDCCSHLLRTLMRGSANRLGCALVEWIRKPAIRSNVLLIGRTRRHDLCTTRPATCKFAAHSVKSVSLHVHDGDAMLLAGAASKNTVTRHEQRKKHLMHFFTVNKRNGG